MSSPALSIVIPSYERCELARKGLQAVYNQVGAPTFEVILIDDGSTDETRVLRSEFPIRYFYLDRPGWTNPARSNNVGIRHARGEFLVLQGADIEYRDRNTLAQLYRASLQDPGAWVFARVVDTARSKAAGHPEGIFCGPENPRPLSFCSILRREHVMAIGGMDEDFTAYGFEDDDFAHRLIDLSGLRPVFSAEINAWHQSHARTGSGASAMQRLYHDKRAAERRGELGSVRNQGREWGKIDFPEGVHPKDDVP